MLIMSTAMLTSGLQIQFSVLSQRHGGYIFVIISIPGFESKMDWYKAHYNCNCNSFIDCDALLKISFCISGDIILNFAFEISSNRISSFIKSKGKFLKNYHIFLVFLCHSDVDASHNFDAAPFQCLLLRAQS